MAGKTKKDDKRPWEVEFIQVELDKSQKEMLKKWDTEGVQTISIIERLVFDGYKLSIWGDKTHDCCGATITSPRGTDDSRPKCLSGRGPDIVAALRAVAYKHHIILEGDWSKYGEWDQTRDQWG
jgi:hypothetical protein